MTASLPLRPIAIAQKRVIYCVLAELLLIAGWFGLAVVLALALPPDAAQLALAAGQPVFLLVYFVLKVAQVMVCWSLFTSIGSPGYLGLLTLCGFLGLIVLLWGSQEATKALKAGGVRVGFLGVSAADLAAIEQPAAT